MFVLEKSLLGVKKSVYLFNPPKKKKKKKKKKNVQKNSFKHAYYNSITKGWGSPDSLF